MAAPPFVVNPQIRAQQLASGAGDLNQFLQDNPGATSNSIRDEIRALTREEGVLAEQITALNESGGLFGPADQNVIAPHPLGDPFDPANQPGPSIGPDANRGIPSGISNFTQAGTNLTTPFGEIRRRIGTLKAALVNLGTKRQGFDTRRGGLLGLEEEDSGEFRRSPVSRAGLLGA